MRNNNSKNLGAEVSLGDIVAVYHEPRENCKDLDCSKRIIGGFVLNITGTKFSIQTNDGTKIDIDTQYGNNVLKIEDLSDAMYESYLKSLHNLGDRNQKEIPSQRIISVSSKELTQDIY